MDTRISPSSRSEVVLAESQPRPTPAPSRVSFSQVLAAGASTIAAGAQTALSKLPGSPIQAAAVRGGTPDAVPVTSLGGLNVNASAQGPTPVTVGGVPISAGVGVGGVGIGIGGSSSDPNGNIQQSMAQMAQDNLYYLQVQEAVDAQNRMFTTLSNVLKTEHDSDKAAINNIHS